MSNSDDSDYKVEDYVIPDSVRNTYRNEDTISDNERGAEESENDSEISQHGEEEIKTPQCKFNGGNDSEQEVDPETPRPNSRFILYVTNLSGETTKTMLEDFFGDAGDIKAIRIPKVRLGCYAFVEMKDFEGFKNGMKFNNREIDGRKIQVYEGSKNKKHTSIKSKNLKRKTQQQHLSTIKMRKKEQAVE